MAKVSISDIAKILVDRHGLPQSEAEQFVTAMFAVVQDALEQDSQVKVKGLGTFKVIGVEARESINVNTGERVVIEGHGKITFTPETSMKDLVNKPFSQFETVILNEGVEFSDMNETADGHEDAAEETALEQPEPVLDVTELVGFVDDVTNEPINEKPSVETETIVAEPVETTVDEPVETTVDEPVETTVDEPVETIVDEPVETTVDEPVAEPVAEPAVECLEEPAEETVEEFVAPEPDVADAEVVETQVMQEEEEMPVVRFADAFPELNGKGDADCEDDGDVNDGEDDGNGEDDGDGNGRSKYMIVYVLVTLALMALSAFGGYWYGMNHGICSNAPTDSIALDKKQVAVAADSMENASADSLVADTLKNKEQVTVKEEVANTSAGDVKDHEYYAAMDERVRTGAYRIVGTDTVLTVRNGETMRRLCKRTLGEGMACYIEVYNDMAPNTPLVPGQKIKIPKLKWKVKSK